MNQWFVDVAHTKWHFHDIYCLGACIFIIHFIWLSPSTLKRKNVLTSLIIMTILWPLTYTLSIYQIMRFRRLKQ
jgi:apolipoprotein N-acyltransferase